MALEEFNNFFTEEELTTKKRNKLDTDIFGIPEERKYPLHDEQHVLSAVTYFGKAEAKYKPELARRIVSRAKELNMEWCQWFDKGKSMSGYLKDLSKSDQKTYEAYSKNKDKKHIKESQDDTETTTLSDTPELQNILLTFSKAGVTYDDTKPTEWKLKSPDEIFDHQKGNCHDTSYYVYKQLHPKHPCGILFFIEYNSETHQGGVTHSVCYEKTSNGICACELSWDEYGIGTFPFNDVKEMAESYSHMWKLSDGFDSLMCVDVTDLSGIHPGMTLKEYVDYMMNHSTEIFNKEKYVSESYDNALSSDEIRHRLDMLHDMTTGVGDYDEHIERDPDDCYTEADKGFFNTLTDKENQPTLMELRNFAKKCIETVPDSKKRQQYQFRLPSQSPENHREKLCYNYFFKLINDIDKSIDKGEWAGKWIIYEKNIKKFFNAIGVNYKNDRVMTGVNKRSGSISFREVEFRSYTFNPQTDILVHTGKAGYKYLKPTHCSRDNIYYPKPRVYFVLQKKSDYKSEDNYGGKDAEGTYMLDINRPITVYFDTEMPNVKPNDTGFMNGKYGKHVFINTYTPLPIKPIDKNVVIKESTDINGKINARMIAERIHEKYEADKQPPTGNQNCQLCSWCAEAQFRGIDILPRPVYSPRDIALTIDGTKIVENPVKQSFKNMEDMIGCIDKLPNSRWYVHVKWIGGTGGHEFLLLNMNNIPEIMDAQQGIVEPVTHMKTFNEYFGNIDWEQSFVCRMDDKPLNDKLLNEMNSMKTFTPWNAKLDIPYMLKEGMLSKEEADDYWRDHPSEAPEKVFTSGDFEKYGKDVDLSDARGPITESVVMEFDHNSEKLPVKAPNTDKVYFGSPRKYVRGIRTDRPLFVTPFMGIASIFIYGDLDIQNKVPRGSYNLQYEEWNTASDEEMSKPFKEVHVYVEGYPELEPYEIENTGYIHTVNASKYKDDFYRYEWMSDKIEYLIDTNESFVDVESVQEVTVHYYVSGKPSTNPKLGPYKKPIQESGVVESAMSNKEYNKLKNDIIDILGKLPTEYHQMLFSYTSSGFIKIDRRYTLIDAFKGKRIDNNISIKKLYNPEELYDSLTKDNHEDDMYKIGTLNPSGYIYYKPSNQKFYIDKNGERVNVGTDKGFFVKMIKETNDSKHIKESYMTFQMLERFVPNAEEGYPDGVWLRPAMKGDLDYITMVEMDTLDDKYKNDPKIQEMIKRDAYESIPRTRIICYTDENNSSQTIGLLQAYQKNDYWYIGEIWLKPEFRGKGIGKAILEKEISKHDWLSLDVNKKNKHAIDLYLSLGFKIVSDNEEGYRMDLKKNSTNIQEGAWNDIKNGVNPFSKKQVFHVTKSGHYDGQIFKPRVPDYIGPYDKDDPQFEDSENPRICFSNSIEGALNAVLVNIGRWKTAAKLGDWYVYIPEKPLKDYKYRTTKQLIKEKKVYDANVTNEIWIEEPVRLKQYGVIHVDQISNKHTVKTVKSPTGKQSQRSRYDFKWHWLVKPKILKDLPYNYSPSEVCKDIESELWGFKYGLNVDGRLKSGNVSEKDYDDLWRLSSPDEFEKAKGGNCDDYVAWESGYLETYGINTFNKYFIDFGDNHHSFIVVKDNDKYIVIDGSIRHIVPKTDMRKECKSIDECFDYIISSIQKKFKDAKVNNIFDFTKLKIDFGTPMKEYIDYIKSHGKKVKNKNTQLKEAWSMDNFERDPSILKMLMESDDEDLSNIEPIEEAATQQFITGFKALRFYLETILKKLGYKVTNDNYKPLIFKIQKDALTTTIDGSDGKGCKIVTRDLDYHMYPNANGMSLSTAKQVLPGFFKDSEQARTEPIHISKYLNESADETDDDENTNDTSLDINIDADGTGDAIDIGIDTCPTQNQYDPKEIEVLNKLIASEADAISDYFDGSKETRIPVLSKLYSDIGEEERFHIEQLLYAKSTITGEKYEPRDPKVRSEYEELLAMGMDEETAMTTAVDKLSISVSSNNDEDMTEEEEEEIKENFDMLLTLSKFITLTNDPILESVIETNTVREDLFNEYTNLIDELFMEEVDNLNRKSSSVDLGSGNPIKMVLGAFRSIYKVIIGLVKRAKTAFLKVRLRDKRRWAWIKKHGIKGLFQNGVYLYFYSDKRNRYEVGQALTFIEIINAMNEKIVKNCKLNVNTSKYNIDGYLKKLSNVEKAPVDKASIIQRIKGNSIEDGMRDLQGMMLQKTKLIVTDSNEAYLEELFFGYTDEKYTMIMNDQEGNEKRVDVSMNVYNQLDIALSALEITGNETNVILEELEKQEGQGGIYASNPKVYNTCVKAASMMVKSIQKFVAAMTSDIKTIFDLNRGLKDIVDKIENVDSTKEERKEGKKELDEYNAANKERSDAAKKEIDDRDAKAIKSTKYRTI